MTIFIGSKPLIRVIRKPIKSFPGLQGAQSRRLHLAPPFLLDSYTPRFQLLSSVAASKKRSAAYAHLQNCNLCPRLCGVNRYEKTGTCLIGAETVKVNTIAPHFGEGKH
jgi:putative pyruvate formate lyase activating enzyme